MDPKIILETARNREEITAIETLLLMQEGERILPELFEVADELNRRTHNGVVTYVRGKQIHYTNICRAECSFCSFRRKKGQKSAFTLTVPEVVRQVRDAGPLKQITLQGGLNPDLSVHYHHELLRAIKEEFPNLHIEGYSPSEIHFLAKRSRMSIQEVLKRLRDAGLDSLSGDSADILNDKVRKKICPDKLRTNDWMETVKTAHRLGIPTTATILFGHIEDEINTGEHFEIIKNIQRETGGFTAFEPIPFLPQGSALAKARKIKSPPSVDSVLRLVALARIFFCKLIRNVTIDWTKVGIPTAMRAVQAGANDVGALAIDAYEIRSPEVNGRLQIPATAIRSAIQKAERTPQERPPYDVRALTPVRQRREELVLV